jgi:hypothetical protein
MMERLRFEQQLMQDVQPKKVIWIGVNDAAIIHSDVSVLNLLFAVSFVTLLNE